MRIIHYGEELEREIISKGYSKKSICEHLGISFETLQARIVDGRFSQSQLRKLVDNRYLPNE